jgi:hypothetical protein
LTFERHERRDREKRRKTKNHFTEEQITQLRALVFDSLCEHQKRWFKQWNRRNRFILKSRQIGATWYFAREALLRALETGNNQIFLSASRAQAFQFKRFIQKLAGNRCRTQRRRRHRIEQRRNAVLSRHLAATAQIPAICTWMKPSGSATSSTCAKSPQAWRRTKGYAAPTFQRHPVKNMKPIPSGLAISSINTVHGPIGWI